MFNDSKVNLDSSSLDLRGLQRKNKKNDFRSVNLTCQWSCQWNGRNFVWWWCCDLCCCSHTWCRCSSSSEVENQDKNSHKQDKGIPHQTRALLANWFFLKDPRRFVPKVNDCLLKWRSQRPGLGWIIPWDDMILIFSTLNYVTFKTMTDDCWCLIAVSLKEFNRITENVTFIWILWIIIIDTLHHYLCPQPPLYPFSPNPCLHLQ